MAGALKGITVEIGGNTTKLGKALKDVDTQTKGLQKELKGVNKLLKYDPKNVTLIKQKQDLLNKSIANTKEKLETLKNAQAQVQAQFDKGEITEQQYRDFQREIVATEQKLKSLEKEAKEFGSTMDASLIKAKEGLNEFGNNCKSAGEKLLPVTAAVGAVGVASVKTAADFESAMSKVQATSGATGSDLEKLRDKALEMGEKTSKSAQESAEALNYMALAGWDTQQMMTGLEPILRLSEAAGSDLATTSDLVTDSMSALGIEVNDLSGYLDICAQAQRSSNTSAQQMLEAYIECGGTMKNLGVSTQESATALGVLANRGLKGSEAGHRLNTILVNLTTGAGQAGKAMKELGISAYDNNGNFKGLEVVLGELNEKLKGCTNEQRDAYLAMIGGKTQLETLNKLLDGQANEWDTLSGKLGNAKGSLNEIAEISQNNLNGQLTKLKSALEGAAIAIGTALLPIIKSLVSVMQGAVDKFNNLSDTTKTIIAVVALVVASIGPLLIIIGQMALGLSSMINIFIKVGPIATKVFGTLKTGFLILKTLLMDTLIPFITGTIIPALQGLWAILMANPIILVIAAIAALVAGFVYLWNNCESFRQFWINLWEVVKQKAIDAWNAVVNFFTVSVPQWFNSVVNWFKQLPSKLKIYFTLALTYARKWLHDMVEKGKETGSKFITSVINFIKQLPSKVWTWLVNTVTKAATWASQMAAKARQAGSQFLQRVSSFMQQLPGKVWSFLSQTIQKAISFATQFAQKGMQAARNFASKIKSGLANLPSQMVSIGKNIIRGILRGLTSGASNLYNKMREIANRALNAAKEKLGIHSPSRVFADEVGKYIPEGITVGIKLNAKNTLEAIQDFASSLTSAIDTNKFLGQTNLATAGINITAKTSGNAELLTALNKCTNAIINNKEKIDYNRMGTEMGKAVAKQSNPIIMNSEKVGIQTASTVEKQNTKLENRMNRLGGKLDYV